MKSDDSHLELVDRYLNDIASEEECRQLEELLKADPQLRSDYLAYARVDAALPAAIEPSGIELSEFDQDSSTNRQASSFSLLRWMPIAATAAAVLLVGLALIGQFSNPQKTEKVATFEQLNDVRWTTANTYIETGDEITAGQRIELASGTAMIRFQSGAVLELIGPAIIEPRTGNSGFLTMGEAHVVANTPESEGFTLSTPASTFIDIGTAFTARVSPDGLSRLDVTEGEVDVLVEGVAPRRFRSGESVYVEPGTQKIMTRIESGDGSPDFKFPTIKQPSDDDYADNSSGHSSIRVVRGELSIGKSGPPEVLIDGQGQQKPDSPRESAFFKTGTDGSFLIDLGQPVAISKINTYSWHQHKVIEEHRERARQRYTLYGFPGDQLPDLTGQRIKAGWSRIARINSDQFFQVNERLDRPAQQACSISAANGEVGRFRYLLWDIKSGSFYGEIDVFGQP